MNINSAIFVPQVPPIAISGGSNTPFAVHKTSPTQLGQWHFFANNNNNNNYNNNNNNGSNSYQQQHQLRQQSQQQLLGQHSNHNQQQQQQHKLQHHQRVFVNANYQYQWASLAAQQQQQLVEQQLKQYQQQQQQKQTTKFQRQQQHQTQQQQQQQQQQENWRTRRTRKNSNSDDNTKSGKKVSNLKPLSTTTTTTTPTTSALSPATCETEVPTQKDDTMQRNGSKASHNAKSQKDPHQQQQNHHQHNSNSKHDSSDSGISTNGHNAHHHHHHLQQSSKSRKSRSSSKRQDGGGCVVDQKKRTTGFSVNDWLGRDMVFYDRRYMSSCAEDNMMPHHNPAHRNSTSSEAAASDDFNSNSSNDDLTGAYTVMSKNTNDCQNKTARSRLRRKQNRKQQRQTNQSINNNSNNNNNNINVQILMEIDEEKKENHRPATDCNGPMPPGTKGPNGNNSNLRKQCTKAAALKAVNMHVKNISVAGHNKSNALTNSASSSSVCSTLSNVSSSSSSFSSSVGSSASSSPTNSAQSSPTASPTVTKRSSSDYNKIARAPQEMPHFKLNMSEDELAHRLRRHIIDPNLLRVYGYPVESVEHEGCIEFLKMLVGSAPSTILKQQQQHQSYNRHQTNVINTNDGLYINYSSTSSYTTNISTGDNSSTNIWQLSDNLSSDSGRNSESGESSPISIDSDSSEVGDDEPLNNGATAFYTPDGSYQFFSERECTRCQRTFHVTNAGEYLTHESCTYHPGRVENWTSTRKYSCCRRYENAEGCCYNALHVWSGTVVGLNGPYNDFVQTRPRYLDALGRRQQSNPTKVYALDCEMSFTGRGLDVTKISVVDYEGESVYEHYVRPDTEIIDYNSRFSGITEKDLNPNSGNSIKSLAEVHRDLLQLFDADTILIGHSLDNDLRALRLVHNTIVDTSITFPHPKGYPYKKGLKTLTWDTLKREIQCGDAGHSCLEDAQASLELMLFKVHEERQQERI